jgi:hypothetical protein
MPESDKSKKYLNSSSPLTLSPSSTISSSGFTSSPSSPSSSEFTSSRSSTPTFSDDDDDDDDKWWNKDYLPKKKENSEEYVQLPLITNGCNRSSENTKKGCQSYSCFNRTDHRHYTAYDCDWKKYYDENAKAYYYYNEQTGEATWIKPNSFFNGGRKKHKKSKNLRKKTIRKKTIRKKR